MLGQRQRAQAPSRRDRLTFAQRRARVVEELALSVIADPKAHADDVRDAREALMGPRGPRGQQRWAISSMTAESKAQLRRLLREALGEPPLPGAELAAAPPVVVTEPTAAALLGAAPTVAAPASPPAPDPLEELELGHWPSPVR